MLRLTMCLLLLAALLPAGACIAWRTQPQPVRPSPVRASRAAVWLWDDTKVLLRDAEVRGDTLYGHTGYGVQAIPTSQIRRLDLGTVSVARSAAGTVVAGAGLVLALLAVVWVFGIDPFPT